MMRPGFIARASCAPGFRPPAPHPLLVLRCYPNGNLLIGFITHAGYKYQKAIPLTRSLIPSGFREFGGPLTDEHSVLGLVDAAGHRRLPKADQFSPSRLIIGSAPVDLTYGVQLPDSEWHQLRQRIHVELGSQP